MLSFAVYTGGKAAEKVDLTGAYVVGTDDVPLRAEISFRNGVITCQKRAVGPAGLALPWDVPGLGRIMLETVRVPERDQPYVLQVELARGRLMRINHKLEDWGLVDAEEIPDVAGQIEKGRDALIKALQADTAADAAQLGEEALRIAAITSEDLARRHAAALWSSGRRPDKQTGALGRPGTQAFGRTALGCFVPLEKSPDTVSKRLSGPFDFVTLPIVWRDLEPSEQTFNWKPLDAWVEALEKRQMPMNGSALLSFNERHVPDWLYIWEHDFDTIRDLAFEHVRRIINRYGEYVQSWDVISGIHANNCFTFSFEQLMELTRMAAALTRQVAVRSTTVIDIVAPWGEYYARNQRTIPPLLYADMAVQSGINFDAFGLQFLFGLPEDRGDGHFTRDMFQISCLLDQFGKLAKPLHISAVQVPSSPSLRGERSDGAASDGGGRWHEPWSEDVQAEWLEQFLRVVLSKPFVDSICWYGLLDHGKGDGSGDSGGLLRVDLSPKPAFDRLMSIRKELHGGARKPPSRPRQSPKP